MARDKEVEAYTPGGVLCFADGLWKPRPPAANAKPRYSVILLFDKAAVGSRAYQDLRRICAVAINRKWGADKAANADFVRSLRLPFRNASDKDYEGFEGGEIYVTPWKDGAQEPPGLINTHGDKIVNPQADVWSGQWGRAAVRAFAFDTSGNKGVSFGLEAVQILKADMPRLDGRRSASEAFRDAPTDELERLGIDPNAPVTVSGVNTEDLPF